MRHIGVNGQDWNGYSWETENIEFFHATTAARRRINVIKVILAIYPHVAAEFFI
jgi:hypothetical protein